MLNEITLYSLAARDVISVAGYYIVAVQPSTNEDFVDSLPDISDKRGSLLENLLMLLNNATDLGVGPSIVDLAPRRRESFGVVNSARMLENRLDYQINIFILIL